MVDDDPIQKMRGRMDQLRRIAGMTHDREMSAMLLKMADEVEADANRLEAERKTGQTVQQQLPPIPANDGPAGG
jgi:hypothetical protein